MHPDIEEFWYRAGYSIFPLEVGEFTYFSVYPTGVITHQVTPENTVAIQRSKGGHMEYFLRGDRTSYTADQMLKLIALKAFL